MMQLRGYCHEVGTVDHLDIHAYAPEGHTNPHGNRTSTSFEQIAGPLRVLEKPCGETSSEDVRL